MRHLITNPHEMMHAHTKITSTLTLVAFHIIESIVLGHVMHNIDLVH